jgi:hypothetical protein
VVAGVNALVVRQAAVRGGRPNPRSISASLLGQLLTSYRPHSDQAGTESVSRSHARCLASTDAKSLKKCSGTESSAEVVDTTLADVRTSWLSVSGWSTPALRCRSMPAPNAATAAVLRDTLDADELIRGVLPTCWDVTAFAAGRQPKCADSSQAGTDLRPLPSS